MTSGIDDRASTVIQGLLAFSDAQWDELASQLSPERIGQLRSLRDQLATLGAEGRLPAADDRCRNESALLQLQAIYEVLPVGITLTDDQGDIIDCNPASEALLGISREEHLSRNYARGWTILDEHGQPMPAEAYASVRALRSGRAVRNQRMQVVTPNGRIWLSVSAVPIHQAGLGVVIAFVDISDLVLARNEIKALSFYDPLTGLANRALFMDRLRQQLSTPRQAPEGLAVLQIDLRGFSEINEAHGHAFGDQVLIEIAARIRAAVPAGLTIARLHADGFAVIVQERPAALASAIRERIEAPIDLGDVALRMQARVGIAIYPDDAAGADALLRNAEISLNRAKRSDLPIQFYDQIMGKRLVRKLELANRLELALENDLLELAFQPQVELDSKRLIGAEALLRWNDEVEGWISPDEFLPIAEKRGMMTAIGQWVLTAACRQLAAWDAGGTPLSGHLAVNVSPTQFDDPAFVDSVKRTLADNRVSAERVELEITENAVARDARRATEVMKSLNALGLALAIDDFGVGYSSLAALRYFPVHTLKIDGSFVQRMQESEGDRSIVQTIIAMAKSLELTPLAEGVETAAQAAALHAMGCDRGQGFYFARPLSAEEFREAWLTREPRRAS